MLRKTILVALAGAAMIPAAAMAHSGGGGGGGGGMGHGGGMGGAMSNAGGIGGGFGGMSGMNNSVGVSTGEATRINSQNSANASLAGIAHGNSSSARAAAAGTSTASLNTMFPGTTTTTTITSGVFAGLTTGMTLMSNGTAVGTVQQIRTTANGSVAVVIVRSANGALFAIPAGKLMLSGGVLSTSSRLAGINNATTFTNPGAAHSRALMHASATGIAHANFHSVLASGRVVSGSLAGLATGLAVKTSTGTMLGTVTQIVTDTSGNIRLVIVTSSTGRTFRLVPTSLTLSGGMVTTTQMVG